MTHLKTPTDQPPKMRPINLASLGSHFIRVAIRMLAVWTLLQVGLCKT